MPDGNSPTLEVQDDIDFTISVACECCCDLGPVHQAMAEQPNFKGALALATPQKPDPTGLIEDADLVLIIADNAGLEQATARLADYKQSRQTTLLLYLQDDQRPCSGPVPGVVVPAAQLPSGLTRLIKALIEPLIPHGLICVDWADTLHVLQLDGQAVVVEASGSQAEDTMADALRQLREQSSDSVIKGMQISISCSTENLKMRLVHTLLTACKEVAGEDATLIAAAPFLDWPGPDRFEIRLFAKLGGSEQQEAQVSPHNDSPFRHLSLNESPLCTCDRPTWLPLSDTPCPVH